jgi:hypothetical protein
MAPFKSIRIAALTTLLVVAAGPMAHHLYETHLSSGYAPILRAALQTINQDERTASIYKARLAVRTDKDRESEAKLEKRQADFDGETASAACRDWKSAADQAEHKWRAFEDNVDLKSSDVQEGRALTASGAYMSCVTASETVAHTEGVRLYQELCTTAGIPVN